MAQCNDALLPGGRENTLSAAASLTTHNSRQRHDFNEHRGSDDEERFEGMMDARSFSATGIR